ncbi:MAG: hypothetical protein DDT42_01589 [candidate division WS2 bacterium]|uniref:Uncharacterized protein n=1 Tax=Psychracetigena formicireducens TaxID=2986056 RepID=A0A9E2BIH7_PSYF1|nr:hypothetical protein [Candidatus Psychracetigena formicireducens]
MPTARDKKPRVSELPKVAASVQTELKYLRSLMEETVSAHLIKRQAQIESIVLAISERESAEEEDWLKDIRIMQRSLRSLKVQPEKGRFRDIKKMTALISNLRRIMEKW